MPVRHIDVTSRKKHHDKVPMATEGAGGSSQSFAPGQADTVEDQRNQTPFYGPVDRGLEFASPGMSEPRSGGAVERAMTAPAHEDRHPQYAGIESGKEFAVAAAHTMEVHNDPKYNDGLDAHIQPPAGHEPFPPIVDPSREHGYDPSMLSYAQEALSPDYMHYHREISHDRITNPTNPNLGAENWDLGGRDSSKKEFLQSSKEILEAKPSEVSDVAKRIHERKNRD